MIVVRIWVLQSINYSLKGGRGEMTRGLRGTWSASHLCRQCRRGNVWADAKDDGRPSVLLENFHLFFAASIAKSSLLSGMPALQGCSRVTFLITLMPPAGCCILHFASPKSAVLNNYQTEPPPKKKTIIIIIKKRRNKICTDAKVEYTLLKLLYCLCNVCNVCTYVCMNVIM